MVLDRKPAVRPFDDTAAHALPERGEVEGLQLDQQLVDDAGDALPGRRAAHPGAGAADGVDLLDETDRAALLAGRLAERLEVGADLAVGLAVVHRLERRRGDEEDHLDRAGDIQRFRQHGAGVRQNVRAGLATIRKGWARG